MKESGTLAPVSNGHIKETTFEQVIIGGDLQALTPDERVLYYRNVCNSVGLNPLTKPFQYIRLNNKLTLYATRDCTDQLRQSRKVSITKLEKERDDALGLYTVTAYAATPDGRTDASTGVVNIKGLIGENLANCLMKSETKAKRRVTLSICGLGWTDESEIETIPGAQVVPVTETGEIVQAPRAALRANPNTGEVIEGDIVDSEPILTPAQEILKQWRALYETEGFKPVESDKAGCREFISHLLGRKVTKLGDLDGAAFLAARVELESRNSARKHWFALLGEYGLKWTDDEQRAELSKMLGREVQTRSTLTSDEWRTAVDGLAQYGPGDGDPFADPEPTMAEMQAAAEDRTIAAMSR